LRSVLGSAAGTCASPGCAVAAAGVVAGDVSVVCGVAADVASARANAAAASPSVVAGVELDVLAVAAVVVVCSIVYLGRSIAGGSAKNAGKKKRAAVHLGIVRDEQTALVSDCPCRSLARGLTGFRGSA
jgi:hypothetical protein